MAWYHMFLAGDWNPEGIYWGLQLATKHWKSTNGKAAAAIAKAWAHAACTAGLSLYTTMFKAGIWLALTNVPTQWK